MEQVEGLLPREATREEELLAGKTPLLTLLWFAIGPFCSQLSSSMYGLASTVWLSNYAGPDTKVALSLVMALDFLPVALGYFLCVSASIELAVLFAEQDYKKAAQVIVDLLRFCLILGVLVPAVLLPIAKPIMSWVQSSAADTAVNSGFDYLVLILGGTVVTSAYYLLCGCLEAEGRTMWFSLAQISSMVLNGLAFDPLTIIALKLGIRGPGVSMLAAELIPGLVILVWFFRGKFSVKPKLALFLNPPIRESRHALALGVSSFISSLSNSLPIIFFQKYLTACASSDSERDLFLALYNDFSRLYSVLLALYLAICMAFLAAGSYAYTARNIMRLTRLLIHSVWMLAVIGISASLTMDFATESVAKLFNIRDKQTLTIWKRTAPKYWSSTTLLSWAYLGTSLLQATNKPVLGLVAALLGQSLMFPAASTFWYFYAHDPVALFWSALTNDTSAFVLTLAFASPALLEIKRRRWETSVQRASAKGMGTGGYT
jgi:Na+-driven multidrug efflux pump